MTEVVSEFRSGAVCINDASVSFCLLRPKLRPGSDELGLFQIPEAGCRKCNAGSAVQEAQCRKRSAGSTAGSRRGGAEGDSVRGDVREQLTEELFDVARSCAVAENEVAAFCRHDGCGGAETLRHGAVFG
jgi:hypothetical protein